LHNFKMLIRGHRDVGKEDDKDLMGSRETPECHCVQSETSPSNWKLIVFWFPSTACSSPFSDVASGQGRDIFCLIDRRNVSNFCSFTRSTSSWRAWVWHSRYRLSNLKFNAAISGCVTLKGGASRKNILSSNNSNKYI